MSEQILHTNQTNINEDKNIPVDALVGLPPLQLNEIYNDDSFKLIERVPAKTVDLILEDMPYNTTQNEWEYDVDLQLYWETRLRILKPTGVIILTATQPFASKLVMSNEDLFRYEIIWNKKRPTNFLNAKKEPLRQHENILLFAKQPPTYNPIFHSDKLDRDFRGQKRKPHTENYGKQREFIYDIDNQTSYPRSIINLTAVIGNSKAKLPHPTQKPVGLFEYLIRTYTNEGDLVFDGFGGSGTTAIAAHKSKRNFIVIEKEKKYFDLAKRRLENERAQLTML